MATKHGHVYRVIALMQAYSTLGRERDDACMRGDIEHAKNLYKAQCDTRDRIKDALYELIELDPATLEG